MRPLLNQPSFMEHQDKIADSAAVQSVRNKNARLSFAHPVKIIENRRFRNRVKRGCGFVQYQEWRFLINSSRYGKLLALSPLILAITDPIRESIPGIPALSLSMDIIAFSYLFCPSGLST